MKLSKNLIQQTQRLETATWYLLKVYDVIYVYFAERKKRATDQCDGITDAAIKQACEIDCQFMDAATVSNFKCVNVRVCACVCMWLRVCLFVFVNQ